MEPTPSNIVVIGGTIAGMTAAIAAAEKGARVTIVSRQPLVRSHDVTQNDGIAAVLHTETHRDSIDQHVRDIIDNASGTASERAVRRMCERAPMFVRFLARAGVLFNRTTEGHLAQVQTEGHTRPRTVRAGDATGQQVVRILEEQVRRLEAKGVIERKEYYVPLSLIVDEEDRCRGMVVMNRTNHACTAQKADAVILTSGDNEWVQLANNASPRLDAGTHCSLSLDGRGRKAPRGSRPFSGVGERVVHHTSRGLIVDDNHMTMLPGLFAAGSSAGSCGGDRTAAHLVGGACAGEAAHDYVGGLTTHADDLGTSLFERASDREEKVNKELMDRSEGENPYVIADELSAFMDQGAAGAYDEEALNKLAERAANAKLPDQSSWWNDGLVFVRDLQRAMTLARATVRAAKGQQ